MDLELPKRLYEEGAEPLCDKINKCARISILKDLASGVKSEYNEVKKDPLFAHIIAIHENRLNFSAKLVHSLMTRQLVTAKKHELWFVFARRPLRFSIQEFHAVTGLKCIDDDNYDLKNWVDDGGFWSKLLMTRGKISLEMIRKKLISEANKWTRVDRLRLVYKRWKTSKKKFELSVFLLAYGKGVVPSHGRTDKVWGVDVDRIYTPVCCGGNHWISLCINFVQRTIDVFECNGQKRYREVDAFLNMVPRIFKEVQPDATKKHLSVAPYSANYVPMQKGLNGSQDHCGVYALKFIECHVLGLDFSLLHDKNIKEARYKIASDLLQAGRDDVLLDRMSKYVAPAFTPCAAVDIS